MIITGTDGRRRERFVPHVAGYPSHPLTRPEVEEKAMSLMGPVLGAARTRAVVDRTRTIDTMTNAGDLVRMIAS